MGDLMHISLYRKYRPQTFSDMVGQTTAVDVLRTALENGSIGHAYLFSGPRGCGKTTVARLVAKSLCCLDRKNSAEPCDKCDNCVAIARGEHLDVVEIDGASNNGVDAIRELKSHVSLRALSSHYKVYIIDEVHMLSSGAFNALLKTLEEPPENVIFLLATTEPHKVPVTIRSRCQHIPFHRISVQDIVSRLEYVCNSEGITADNDALWEIARMADGALRDALSLTEQAISLGHGTITRDAIDEMTGGASRTRLEAWVVSLLAEPNVAASSLAKIISSGTSCERLCEQIFIIFCDLWYAKLWQNNLDVLLESSQEEISFLKNEAQKWDERVLRRCAYVTNKIMSKAHNGINGEYFAGLLFLELKNAIDGVDNSPAKAEAPVKNPQAQVTPQPIIPNANQNTSNVQPEQKKVSAPVTASSFNEPSIKAPSSFDERVDAFTSTKSDKIDTSNFTKSFGECDFTKIIEAVSQDNYEFAAALLDTKVLQNGDEIIFEATDSPLSAAFLNIPFNKEIASLAVKKAFGLIKETPAEEKNEAQPSVVDALQNPVQRNSAGASAQEINQGTTGGVTQAISANAGRILKLAGAELLYVEKDVMDLEEENDG